ncbi:hypothetical protein IWW57_003054 [Coemansia sp. S610]|nr:hypothetical protein IWW57_003054 [Coemansia sp. S610]KAJ2416680.1 hypothetical protein GGI10_000795 [Coemansia sp. RSA 2530]
MKLHIALFTLGVASASASIIDFARVHSESIAAGLAQRTPGKLASEGKAHYAQTPVAPAASAIQAAPVAPAAHQAPVALMAPAAYATPAAHAAHTAPPNGGTTKRERFKVVLGNPEAAWSQASASAASVASLTMQTAKAGGRNINKEVKDALLRSDDGRGSDNNLSSLLLEAIASSHGDLPVVYI